MSLYTQQKVCLFLTLTREMLALTDLIDIIFDDFQYINNSHCEISLHHQLLKNSSQGRFYHPYVSFKNTDPIALSFILSAEYSVKKALDKPLFGYQHLL